MHLTRLYTVLIIRKTQHIYNYNLTLALAVLMFRLAFICFKATTITVAPIRRQPIQHACVLCHMTKELHLSNVSSFLIVAGRKRTQVKYTIQIIIG